MYVAAARKAGDPVPTRPYGPVWVILYLTNKRLIEQRVSFRPPADATYREIPLEAIEAIEPSIPRFYKPSFFSGRQDNIVFLLRNGEKLFYRVRRPMQWIEAVRPLLGQSPS